MAGVSKAVIISAIPPYYADFGKKSRMAFRWKCSMAFATGTGQPIGRSFYQDITIPFYGYNRPGAKISQGIRDNWWRQGMMGGIKAHYDCVKVFSETEFLR